jgi:hypothetical protein
MTPMKTKLIIAIVMPALLLCAIGCVSLPPLVKVEHKETNSNEAVAKRLESIDHRLDQLEKTKSGP